MRVLIVEDDAAIVAGLRAALSRLGWAVESASSIAAAWSALCSESFDVILLDLGLDDGDGAELLRRLRSARSHGSPDPLTPVLIMTARDQVESRIEGLDAGADDYVSKPFDAGELAARVRALRRRSTGRASSLVTLGALQMDPAARSVSYDRRPVELSVREFAVLLALVEVSPRVLSRAQLEAKVYTWDHSVDSNSLEVHIHRIRRKLDEKVIRTMRGVGYFVPAAE
jgi:two-component system response regulator QseB